MYVTFNILSPERSPSPQRLQRRVPQRLRALLVFPGKRRVHLGCLPFGASCSIKHAFLDGCRARLEQLGVPTAVADRLLVQVRERAEAVTAAPSASPAADQLRARASALAHRLSHGNG